VQGADFSARRNVAMVLCRALIFQLDVMWPPWVKQIEVGHNAAP
jgi:hypothetical protein